MPMFPPLVDWDVEERVVICFVECVAGCGATIPYEMREFQPQGVPLILCDTCAAKHRGARECG